MRAASCDYVACRGKSGVGLGLKAFVLLLSCGQVGTRFCCGQFQLEFVLLPCQKRPGARGSLQSRRNWSWLHHLLHMCAMLTFFRCLCACLNMPGRGERSQCNLARTPRASTRRTSAERALRRGLRCGLLAESPYLMPTYPEFYACILGLLEQVCSHMSCSLNSFKGVL